MLKQFGYDMLPVLAGVLLALIINNYQQKVTERNFASQILERIVEENDRNIASIEDLLMKQQKTIDTLNHYADSAQYSIYDLIQKVNGVSTPDLLDNGNRFLFQSNQTLVDVQTLLQLAAIQEAKESYDISVRFVINAVYTDLYLYGKSSKKRLALMLSDLMNYERNILMLSREFNESYQSR